MEAFAYFALLAFVPLAVFGAFRRFRRATATSLVVMAGSLFLPENIAFDLPAVPPMDKEYITFTSVLLGAIVYQSRAIRAARPGFGPEAILLLMIASNTITVFANGRSMWDEGVLEEGLTLYAVLAQTADDVLMLLIPFFVGRALIRTRDDLETLLKMLVLAGLAYTVLIVVEIVMSIPFRVFQLSDWIYGLKARPNWRWGVIQPVVFMGNGLAIATFMATSLLAGMALARGSAPGFWGAGVAFRGILATGLFMTRNVAGNLYGFSLSIALRILPPRVFAAGALALALFACVYPVLRIVDVFPNDDLVRVAKDFDEDRARSLKGRFDEEEHVLGLIGDRFWVGWGSYTRIPGAETFGEGEVGLDPWWIIKLGTHGAIGFGLEWLLMTLPVAMAMARIGRLRSLRDQAMLAALMAAVAIRLVDLLINGWWNSLPAFLAGALFGVTLSLQRQPVARRTRAIARDEAPVRVAARSADSLTRARRSGA